MKNNNLKEIVFESVKDFEIQNLDEKAAEKIFGGRRVTASATSEVTCTPNGNNHNDED